MLKKVALVLNLFMFLPSLCLAKDEGTSLKVRNYLIDSVAKLDDVVEDLDYKERVNDLDRVSFTLSTLLYLTPISISMISYNLQHSSILPLMFMNPAKSELTMMTTLQEFFNNLAIGVTSLRLLSESKSFQAEVQSVSIHRKDLLLLKSILKDVREKQIRLLESDFKVHDSLKDHQQITEKIETQILESRHSYQDIYESCVKNPELYRQQMRLEILKGSLHDLYFFTTFSPSVIKLQLDSKLASPTLFKYLSQQALPQAIKNCFSHESAGKESFESFSQDLHTVENLARGLVVSTLGTGFAASQRLLTHPKIQGIANYFSKGTLFAAKRITLLTTMIAGLYASVQLKKSYDLVSGRNVSRYSREEYIKYVNAYYKKQISQQIESTEKQLKSVGNNSTRRTELEDELRAWKKIESELSQST